MTEIKLVDTRNTETDSRNKDAENWYAEPFTKRDACQTPGECDDDCDCGCPYTPMTSVEQLPLIETIAAIFPNEWLAFIISPEEDDDYEPTHGKLVAHSSTPDDIYDAVNTVLWNQHVYVFFNGNFEAMHASYGTDWDKTETVHQRTANGPQQPVSPTRGPKPVPNDLIEFIYSAIDELYDPPNINEAIRKLRLARVQAMATSAVKVTTILDEALEKIEIPEPSIDGVIWYLEDALASLDTE